MLLTRLKVERMERGWSQRHVAELCETDHGNYLRIENGQQQPKAELARKLFDLFDGRVPLGAIYDPTFAAERGLDGLARAPQAERAAARRKRAAARKA